jgi:hypothetical protein
MHLAQVDRAHFAGEYGRERRDGDGQEVLPAWRTRWSS